MPPRPLTRADVLHVARLAHLQLTDAEIDQFTGQLAEIVAYAAEIQQIDTTGIVPTSHAASADPVWREDTGRPSLDRGAALANAPDANAEAGLFRVPKVR